MFIQKIIEKSEIYSQEVGMAIGKRHVLENMIENSITIEELLKVIW